MVAKADDILSGSIKVILECENKRIEDVEMHLSKVADIVEGEYVLRPNYKDLNIDINNIESAESLKNVSDMLAKCNNIDAYTIVTDKHGEGKFENLEEGIYILTAEAKDGFKEISATMVKLPFYDESTNNFEYNIICEPKIVLDKPDSPKTGDNMDVTVYVISVLASIALIASISIQRKKNKSLDNK